MENIVDQKQKHVSIRSVIKSVRKGGEVSPYATKEQIDFANKVVNAEKFITDYIKKNGTKAFVSERLRDGFIGMERKVNGHTVIQTERGAPFGTIVAIPTKNEEAPVAYGTSYIDSTDMLLGASFPVYGQYLALLRAIKASEQGIDLADDNYKYRKAEAQINHFKKRSLAFFYPDIYSYSRGQEGKKVVYENYDVIHARREAILAAKK